MLLLLILFIASDTFASELYIVEGARGIKTFTSRKPVEGVKYTIAGKDFGYVSKVKSYDIYGSRYSRGRLAPFRPVDSTRFDELIKTTARNFGVDSHLVKAVIHVESAFRPYARSPKGALGLMQIMPGTARRFGARNISNPEENIYIGVKYLRWLLKYFNNREILALAAYNAGEGAVDKYGGIPPYPETRNYVQKVLRARRAYQCLSQGSVNNCVF